MSVIKSKRQESKLAVLTKAYELASYTITICKNEKAFPKRDRWILTQPIVRECLDAVTCIRRANAVRVATQQDYDYRRGQQAEARCHLDAMLTLVDIAYTALGLPGERVEYWTGLAIEAENYVQRWRRSDKLRFAAFSATETDEDPPTTE